MWLWLSCNEWWWVGATCVLWGPRIVESTRERDPREWTMFHVVLWNEMKPLLPPSVLMMHYGFVERERESERERDDWNFLITFSACKLTSSIIYMQLVRWNPPLYLHQYFLSPKSSLLYFSYFSQNSFSFLILYIDILFYLLSLSFLGSCFIYI